MNWNKLTKEFQILCVFVGTVGFLISLLEAFMIISPEFSLLANVIFCIGFLILAWRDVNARKRTNIVAASGWWSLLGIAYPIAVSFKEKSWNSILWYSVVSFFIPTVLLFMICFGAELMGVLPE